MEKVQPILIKRRPISKFKNPFLVEAVFLEELTKKLGTLKIGDPTNVINENFELEQLMDQFNIDVIKRVLRPNLSHKQKIITNDQLLLRSYLNNHVI